MLCGRLRNPIEVHARTSVLNAIGEETTTYLKVSDDWAEVIPMGAMEVMRGEELQLATRFDIRKRYDSTLTTGHRIVWGTRTLEIIGMIDMGARGREHLLTCVELV